MCLIYVFDIFDTSLDLICFDICVAMLDSADLYDPVSQIFTYVWGLSDLHPVSSIRTGLSLGRTIYMAALSLPTNDMDIGHMDLDVGYTDL